MITTDVHKHEMHLSASSVDEFRQRPDDDSPYLLPKTCSYCGSLHPEDVLAAMKAGAKIEWADFKYGWPHKLYIDLPNLKAGKDCVISTCQFGAGYEPTEQDRKQYDKWSFIDTPNGRNWTGKKTDAAPVLAHGKFYSVHLNDASPEVFAELAALIESNSGVLFERDERGVKYRFVR